jgi:uncharacterized protein YbjT (DUF2867 family)
VKVFLAGATGVLGIRLVPLLVGAGYQVLGLTRSAAKVPGLADLGAEALVADVYEAEALAAAVVDFAPDLVLHQLTDLPDDPRQVPGHLAANARIRREGTRNLLAASAAAGAERFVAQSVAWTLAGDGAAAVAEHEAAVLAADGVVVRYGQLHGPGTFFPDEPPPPPRIHVDRAALRTMDVLDLRATTVELVDDP